MATDDFFRARLDQMIDLRHPLAVLAGRIPWTTLESSLGPIPAHRDRKVWHEIQAAAGVARPDGKPWLLHECRHTLVSMLLANGVDRSVIAAIVGQSALVEAYVHVDRAKVREAMAGMADMLQLGG